MDAITSSEGFPKAPATGTFKASGGQSQAVVRPAS